MQERVTLLEVIWKMVNFGVDEEDRQAHRGSRSHRSPVLDTLTVTICSFGKWIKRSTKSYLVRHATCIGVSDIFQMVDCMCRENDTYRAPASLAR